MNRKFHQDYADSVSHFCQSIPPELGISTQEVDAYFRACALFLWAGTPGRGGGVAAISQIYTSQPVRFTDVTAVADMRKAVLRLAGIE